MPGSAGARTSAPATKRGSACISKSAVLGIILAVPDYLSATLAFLRRRLIQCACGGLAAMTDGRFIANSIAARPLVRVRRRCDRRRAGLGSDVR